MTASKRPVCDCPEPCTCYAKGYAAGKDEAYFTIKMAQQETPTSASCGIQPCQNKRACLRKAMTLLGSSSLVLEGHDHRD